MTEKQNTIAYLAPEIPGPSSTFVYNEIIEVERLGLEVIPYSLHSINLNTNNEAVRNIANKCSYLYEAPFAEILKSNVKRIIATPFRYISTLAICLTDCVKCFRKPKIATGLIYRFFIASHLVAQPRFNEIKHLHCHFSHISTDVAMYAALQSHIPFSFTAHANDIFERGYLLKEKGKRAKFVATISKYNISVLQEKGIPKDKLKLVRCGVDTEKFLPRARRISDSSPKTIGFLGRLVEKKGVDLLIGAVGNLINQNVPVRLEIMGSGPLEHKLRAQVTELGIDRSVYFGGALNHDQVSEWFGNIDYFAFPGKVDSQGDMDGIPVVLMEAMMRGVPVIATSVSGIPELVVNNQTGKLAHPSVESLARELKAICAEPEHTLIMRANRAINLVRQEFNLARNVQKLAGYISSGEADYQCQTHLHS